MLYLSCKNIKCPLFKQWVSSLDGVAQFWKIIQQTWAWYDNTLVRVFRSRSDTNFGSRSELFWHYPERLKPELNKNNFTQAYLYSQLLAAKLSVALRFAKKQNRILPPQVASFQTRLSTMSLSKMAHILAVMVRVYKHPVSMGSVKSGRSCVRWRQHGQRKEWMLCNRKESGSRSDAKRYRTTPRMLLNTFDGMIISGNFSAWIFWKVFYTLNSKLGQWTHDLCCMLYGELWVPSLYNQKHIPSSINKKESFFHKMTDINTKENKTRLLHVYFNSIPCHRRTHIA